MQLRIRWSRRSLTRFGEPRTRRRAEERKARQRGPRNVLDPLAMRKTAVYTLALLSFPVRNRLSASVRRILAIRKVHLVLVFGLSRSGTTFLAEALTLRNERAIKMHEPVKKLLRLSYQGEGGRSADDEAFWNWVFETERIPWKVHLLVCTIAVEVLRASNRLVCVKPISMSDCIGQAAAATGGSVVFISRHPCGRSDSLMRQRTLEPDAPRPDARAFEEMGREWGRAHADFQHAHGQHPDWIWLKFEELCDDPIYVLKEAYGRLGLAWSEQVESELTKMTSTESSEFYGTRRNSRAQIDKWKQSLTDQEVEAIRAGVRPYATGLYEGF